MIRGIDADTIIVCGTTTWSQDIHIAADRPVAATHNIMYTFHFYVPIHMGLIDRYWAKQSCSTTLFNNPSPTSR